MIGVQPYDAHGAMAVLSSLDPFDWIEAQMVRGELVTHLGLFADWHMMRGAWVASHVLTTRKAGGSPFAVLAISNTGQAGVAQAAFLARDHTRYRLPIARTAILMRAAIGSFCAERGIHRIEARCWADHPTAARFLASIGFVREAIMPGFGPAGEAVFLQFAYVPLPDQEF